MEEASTLFKELSDLLKERTLRTYITPKRSIFVLPVEIERFVTTEYPTLLASYIKVQIEDFGAIGEDREKSFIKAYLAFFPLYVARADYDPSRPDLVARMYDQLRRKVKVGADEDRPEAAFISVDAFLERPSSDRPRVMFSTLTELATAFRRRVDGGTLRPPSEGEFPMDHIWQKGDIWIADLEEPGNVRDGFHHINFKLEIFPKNLEKLIFYYPNTDALLAIEDNFLSPSIRPSHFLPKLIDFSNLRNVVRIGDNFLKRLTGVKILKIPFERLGHIGDSFMADIRYAPNHYVEFPNFSELQSIGNRFLLRANLEAIDLSGATELRTIGSDFCRESNIKIADLSGLSSIERVGPRFFYDTFNLETVLFRSLNTQNLINALKATGRPKPFFSVAPRIRFEAADDVMRNLDIVFDLPDLGPISPRTLNYFEPTQSAWKKITDTYPLNPVINFKNSRIPFSNALMKAAWKALESSVWTVQGGDLDEDE